jgi:hypothetical protein
VSPVATRIAAAFSDVRATDLRLRLDLPAQAALVSRTIADGGRTLDLRILGASHQVLLREGSSVLCTETVACPPDGAVHEGGLPGRLAGDRNGVRHRFRSTTLHLAPDDLRARVSALVDVLAADPAAVCGVFPGDPLAVTGVRARFRSPAVTSWRTWHSYPQTGELVVTCTRVEGPPAPPVGRRR